MTYAFFAWEFAADAHLLKLQHLQNEILRTTGKFPRRAGPRVAHGFPTTIYLCLHN
jgi:hypothetical protein